MDGPADTSTPPATSSPSSGELLQAVLAYVGPLFLLTMWRGHSNAFLRFHSRQGFGLFLLECVLLAIWIVLSRTVGQIPFLGIVVMVVVDAVAIVSVVVLIAVGAVKAAAGERTALPFVGRWVDSYLP